jgi:nucleoside-diphosphate-sugar epimerase
MPTKPKVLVTGASGLLGGLAIRDLSDKFEFSGLSRTRTADFAHTRSPNLDESVPWTPADITDFDAIAPAFAGRDMVLHLANYTGDADTWEQHLSSGIVGTRNVFEAARQAGAKRVVFGSTGDTMCGWEAEAPYGYLAAGKYDRVEPGWAKIDYTSPIRPNSVYGACKAFGEALGRVYSDLHGMSVIVIRLGAVLEPDGPVLRRHYPGYLGQQDYLSMVEKCLNAPASLRYDIFDAISNNQYKWRSTDHATEVLGWQPQQSAEDFQIEDPGGWDQVRAFNGEK